jgi:hypothetical protein
MARCEKDRRPVGRTPGDIGRRGISGGGVSGVGTPITSRLGVRNYTPAGPQVDPVSDRASTWARMELSMPYA